MNGCLSGYSERTDGQGVFDRQAERNPARHQQAQSRTPGKQTGERGSGWDDRFEVVEDEQGLAGAEEPCDSLGRRLRSRSLKTQCLKDRRKDEPWVAQRGQWHERHPVGELRADGGRGGQRQTRLADTTGTGQRQQRHVTPPDQAGDPRDLVIAADQRRPCGTDRHDEVRVGNGAVELGKPVGPVWFGQQRLSHADPLPPPGPSPRSGSRVSGVSVSGKATGRAWRDGQGACPLPVLRQQESPAPFDEYPRDGV